MAALRIPCLLSVFSLLQLLRLGIQHLEQAATDGWCVQSYGYCFHRRGAPEPIRGAVRVGEFEGGVSEEEGARLIVNLMINQE